MGVINLTKNSFYSASVRTTDEEVRHAAIEMAEQGADLIDVGATSTAPYRKFEVSMELEKRLLVRALKNLARAVAVPISVDTTRFEPARAAFKEGARTLNDVYGFTQKDAGRLADLVASIDGYLLTTAHEILPTRSPNPLTRVVSCLRQSLDFAKIRGIDATKITVDPGIGFFMDSKISNLNWSSQVISNLDALRKLRRPVAIGVSRKRFVGEILGKPSPDDRLYGSLGATAVAVGNGAHLIRTHDLMPTLEAVKVVSFLREKRFNPPRE
jgi:dihydropteroate synthase